MPLTISMPMWLCRMMWSSLFYSCAPNKCGDEVDCCSPTPLLPTKRICTQLTCSQGNTADLIKVDIMSKPTATKPKPLSSAMIWRYTLKLWEQTHIHGYSPHPHLHAFPIKAFTSIVLTQQPLPTQPTLITLLLLMPVYMKKGAGTWFLEPCCPPDPCPSNQYLHPAGIYHCSQGDPCPGTLAASWPNRHAWHAHHGVAVQSPINGNTSPIGLPFQPLLEDTDIQQSPANPPQQSWKPRFLGWHVKCWTNLGLKQP